MSTSITTVKQLSDNIVAQLEATLNQTIPLLPKSFLRVLSRAMAATYILLYKYIGFGVRQGFVRTASAKETNVNGMLITPLYEWGELIGVGLPAPATSAELTIRVGVESLVGSLPAGTQLLYPATGVTYITLTAVALDAPTKEVDVQAVAAQDGGDGSGVIGNVGAGQFLSFANPQPNVLRNAEVLTQVVTGADGEAVEVYRQRVIDRFRARPQGGALTDYRVWGEEPAGILRVYPYRDAGCPGQVLLYVEATPESSGSPDGIPTPAQLQEVLDAVELDENGLASRRPVGALANAVSISRTVFDVEVQGLTAEDTITVQGQVTQAVTEYLAEREPFIIGLDFSPRLDRVTASAIGGIVDDIVSAAGGVFDSVVLRESAISIQTYTLGAGEKAKAGAITFT
jgi:uncharacterized phage protein gp47/JayE